MDREVFLRALTFLIEEEEQTSTWPPPDAQVMLQHDHVVSLEPISCKTSPQPVSLIGPAFFAPPLTDPNSKKDASFDPSMCPVEIAIRGKKSLASPSASSGSSTTLGGGNSSNSSTTASSQSPRNQQQQHKEGERLYLCIDKRVFRVDMRQLSCMEIISGVPVKQDETSKTYLPPCLMLYFDTCCFRIFNMTACRNHDSRKNAPEVLQKAYSTLQTLAYGRDAPPPQLSSAQGSTCTTPTGSSTTTLEPGQRESALVDSAPNNESLNCTKESSRRHDSLLKELKRRHASLQSSWDGIQSLLTTPALPLAKALNKGKASSLEDVLGPHMTSIAQDLSESRQHHVSTNDASLRLQQEDDQAKLNQLLECAFPPPLKKRQRRRQRGGDNDDMLTTPPTRNTMQDNVKDWEQQAHDLLQRQRQTTEARHNLAMLPSSLYNK